MKQEQRRVSMEKHEIAYCRRVARKIIAGNQLRSTCRLAKSYIKVTKGYSKRR